MSDIRQRVVKALIKTKLGLTTREIAEELSMKVQVVNGSLVQMAQSGFIERGEYIEGEGQIWLVTELGVAEYGNKSDVESLLAQNEKTPVETIEAAPIVEESALEQIEDFETRISPNQESAIHDFNKHRSVAVDSEMETTAPLEIELTTGIESFEIPKHAKMNTENFKVWQIVDDMGEKLIELISQSKAKPIENIDHKIAVLENLADWINPKHGATLREIAVDLRG